MKKQRLNELLAKSVDGKAEIADVIEIISEMYLSQSIQSREYKNYLEQISTRIDSMKENIDQLIKYTNEAPLMQMLLDNMNEEENLYNSLEEDLSIDGSEFIDNEDP